jgi:hypothetical protein
VYKAGENFSQGVEQDVDNQGKATPVPVREQSEEKRSDGAKGESDGDRECNLRIGFVQLLANCCEAKNDQKEIKGIKHPAKKTRQDSCIVIHRSSGPIS